MPPEASFSSHSPFVGVTPSRRVASGNADGESHDFHLGGARVESARLDGSRSLRSDDVVSVPVSRLLSWVDRGLAVRGDTGTAFADRLGGEGERASARAAEGEGAAAAAAAVSPKTSRQRFAEDVSPRGGPFRESDDRRSAKLGAMLDEERAFRTHNASARLLADLSAARARAAAQRERGRDADRRRRRRESRRRRRRGPRRRRRRLRRRRNRDGRRSRRGGLPAPPGSRRTRPTTIGCGRRACARASRSGDGNCSAWGEERFMNLISIGKPEVVSRKLPSLSDLHGVACNSLRMSAFRSSSFAGRARHARAISRSCALSSTSSWPSSSFSWTSTLSRRVALSRRRPARTRRVFP